MNENFGENKSGNELICATSRATDLCGQEIQKRVQNKLLSNWRARTGQPWAEARWKRGREVRDSCRRREGGEGCFLNKAGEVEHEGSGVAKQAGFNN